MKIQNPRYKKIKKALPMQISCGQCKEVLIDYQKKGKGNVLRLYIERVVQSAMPLGEQALTCPYCQNVLGYLMTYKNQECYKMMRGQYNTQFRL